MQQRLSIAKKVWLLYETSNPLGSGRFITDRLFWYLLEAAYAAPYSLSIKSLREEYRLATDGALRKTLRRLEREGWVQIEGHPDDRRVHCVLPTAQFVAVATRFMTDLDAIFGAAASVSGQSEAQGASVRGR